MSKSSVVLTVLSAFATLSLLWILGGTLPFVWRMLVAIYGAVIVTGILSALYKE